MAWPESGKHPNNGGEGKSLLETTALLQFLVSKLTDCFHATLVSPCKFMIFSPPFSQVDSQFVNPATNQRIDCVHICRQNHNTAPEIYKKSHFDIFCR